MISFPSGIASLSGIDWEFALKVVAGIGIPLGLFMQWWTHMQRSTFEMIDRLYGLCHTLQGRVLDEWRLSRLYCIGEERYDEARRRVAAGATEALAREQMVVTEREFAVHILVSYEQVYFQWKHSGGLSRRRRFLESMLAYFVDRLLLNPRILGFLEQDPSGRSLHLEDEAVAYLRERWKRCQCPDPDRAGPFVVATAPMTR